METDSLEKSLPKSILLCRQDYAETSSDFKRFTEIENELSANDIKQITAFSLEEVSDYVKYDSKIQCILL